ncbi:MAG: NAD-dependent epimerase/dehydratase family protein [Pseudomonadota bacterium]
MSDPSLNPPAPEVSVIIVNYNGGGYLAETLRCVLASTLFLEALVVDNGSDDGSFETAREALGGDPRLRFIQNGGNLGFSAANNLALRQAAGRYLLLLNPDCLVAPDTFSRMIAAMEERPTVGMAGCLIRNLDGSEQVGCRRAAPTPWRSLVRVLRLNRLLPKGMRPRSFELYEEPLPVEPVAVEALSGAFMLVRREALVAVGLMDEGYFLHCEDLDWCESFRQHGWEVLFVPSVVVTHHKGVCSTARPLFILWHKHRGMVRYFRKFLRSRYPAVIAWVVPVAVWSRFAILAIWTMIRRKEMNAGQGKREETGGTSLSPQSQSLSVPESLRQGRVLVTGGTGFIGRRLVDTLVGQGVPVRILTRQPERARILWSDQVEIHSGDLTAPESLAGVCDGITTLFHLASHAHDFSPDGQGETLHQRITESGTQALLSEARAGGIQRLVFASSVKAMGEGGEVCLDEEAPVLPVGAYGQSKAVAERLVFENGARQGWHTAVLRLPMVYGHGSKGNLPRMIRAIRRGGFPPLPEVANRRSMIHVDDVVQALLLLAGHPQANGQVFIATDGEIYSTQRLYRLIHRELGRPLPSWSLPLAAFRLAAWLGEILARAFQHPVGIDSSTVVKLFGSAWYRHDRIQTLGFSPRCHLAGSIRAIVTPGSSDGGLAVARPDASENCQAR